MTIWNTHEIADPQAGGECPHCGTWHPCDPAACEVSDARVQMAADYAAHHPGSSHIDVGLAVSADTPGSMAKGYRAVNEALARGLIEERRTAAGLRLYVMPAPGDPYPLVPDGEHPVIPRTGPQAYRGDVSGTCRWPRFDFAIAAALFVMQSRDMNLWALSYPEPRDEYEWVITGGTLEDHPLGRRAA